MVRYQPMTRVTAVRLCRLVKKEVLLKDQQARREQEARELALAKLTGADIESMSDSRMSSEKRACPLKNKLHCMRVYIPKTPKAKTLTSAVETEMESTAELIADATQTNPAYQEAPPADNVDVHWVL